MGTNNSEKHLLTSPTQIVKIQSAVQEADKNQTAIRESDRSKTARNACTFRGGFFIGVMKWKLGKNAANATNQL